MLQIVCKKAFSINNLMICFKLPPLAITGITFMASSSSTPTLDNNLLPSVDVAAKGTHKSTIIWLHGLGDSGNGFAPIAPQLRLDPNLGVKFIFPHAPIRPVTINNGMKMRAWYDIKSISMESRADVEGVLESSEQVKQLIENEIANGIAASKIMLIGFSQGGVIALHLGPRFEQSLAGIVALSTYMCESKSLATQKHDANQNTPFLCCHGTQDEVVPPKLGKLAFNTLKKNGYNATYKEYPMPHSVCMPEVEEIARFITARLA
jgi:phospholipase/carboxylesterase